MIKRIHNCLVDTEGNVYNLDGTPKRKHLSQGYYVCCPGGKLRKAVHLLVLEAFVGEKPEGTEACHNNGIRTDNRLENLRWDTRKSNLHDRKLHGTDNSGERHGLAKLKAKDVLNIRELIKAGFSQRSIAEVYGLDQSTISRVNTRSNWGCLL